MHTYEAFCQATCPTDSTSDLGPPVAALYHFSSRICAFRPWSLATTQTDDHCQFHPQIHLPSGWTIDFPIRATAVPMEHLDHSQGTDHLFLCSCEQLQVHVCISRPTLVSGFPHRGAYPKIPLSDQALGRNLWLPTTLTGRNQELPLLPLQILYLKRYNRERM